MSEAHVAQDGPQGPGEFTYVDISSIDRETKRIVGPKLLPSAKAPSRAKQVLKAGDVLVSMTRPNLNAVALVTPELDGAIGSTGFHVLRARDAEPEFLFYAVQTPDFIDAMSRKVQGALYPAVRPKDIASFCVHPFSLPQQRRIVAEIGKQFTRLEAGVAALRRVQANLKRHRAAVLKAACEGKLVPTEVELVRGKGASGLETGEALLRRILADRRAKWRGRGKYKEPVGPSSADLPQLPGGWIWASVQQLGEVQLGRQRSPKNVSKDFPTKYLRAANITERGLALSDVLEMEFRPEEREGYRLRNGDIMLSEASGSASQVGKPAVWHDELPFCCFQNTLLRLRPVVVDPRFPLAVFQHFYINGIFAQVASGIGINHLGADKFARIAFPLPPLAEQARIVAEVERRLSVVEELEMVVSANLRRAARLRQSILQKALVGNL
jgi:type I restriction enzyme S subunit